MIYTKLTKKAMRIAYARHHGQMDKAGLPYIFHPYHLAEQMEDDEYAVCTALLHDVVEDTGMTFDELEAEGFPAEMIRALKLLTHQDGGPYLGKYIEDIKKDPLARKVKMADLRHNLDATRLPPARTEAERIRNEKRCEKYRQALAFLES